MTEQRSGTDRRRPGRPKGGRRASDPIINLATHLATHVDVNQLADYWGKHAYTVHIYIRKKQLLATKVGGMYRIRKVDALAFERNDPQWRRH